MAGEVRYAIGAVMILAAIDAATSSDAAAGRVGGVFSGVATALQYLISPGYPLVPNRALAKSGGGSGGGGSSGGGGPILPDPPVMLPPLPFPAL